MKEFYNKAVSLLMSKDKFHIELGLERVSAVLAYFNNPQNKLKIVHVAGTNGKGSVCTILSKILEKSGYKVGLFTSPHITSYTERIKINNKSIEDEPFYNLVKKIDHACTQTNTYLTEFEILAVACFLYFAEAQIDIAIIEVGLGGRLDATNVIQHPILEIITSVSLDHTDRLGNTIEQISKEKAGIIKQNSTCITSKDNAGLKVIQNIANRKNAKLITCNNNVLLEYTNDKAYAIYNTIKYEFGLKGLYQEQNLSLAFAAIDELKNTGLDIPSEAIASGLKEVRHIGRFEYFKDANIVIDGAHNPDGAKALRDTLNKIFPNTKITFVYASISTKDYNKIIKNLLTEKDEIYFYKFKRENAVDINELTKITQKSGGTIENIEELKDLAKQKKDQNSPVVFTGSLYAISELYQKNYF